MSAFAVSVLGGGDEALAEAMERCVAETVERLAETGNWRRPEFRDLAGVLAEGGTPVRYGLPQLGDPPPQLVAATPRTALKQGSRFAGGDPVDLILVLPGNRWDDEVGRVCEAPHYRLCGIFRAEHLFGAQGRRPDSDETAAFEAALKESLRRFYRATLPEEAFVKEIHWKAHLDAADPEQATPSLFSLFSDPSMKELLFQVKSAIQDLRRSYSWFFEGLWQSGTYDGAGVPGVLILGESGVGKTLVAQWIKRSLLGKVRMSPFNISAVGKEMIDVELFGNVRGAFTDAREDRPGLLESSRGGAVFLDEIGDMDLRHQTRLLSYMDTGRVRRMGGPPEGIPSPVLLLATTNRPLREWVRQGRPEFRADLYHRFDHQIEIPPLRKRTEDMRLLISLALQDEAVNPRKEGEPVVRSISLDAIGALERRDYPGNFRELRAVLRASVQTAAREGRTTLLLRHLQSL
ncbi:MAG: sigma 54-interacting transcriptional regulator [Synergistales bacterium]|nr:sigma 54-interacting transcriptional regulator [Synergistales bacterium]